MIKQRGQIVIDKILDTAERLFYTQGYCNTGINQVIAEADIAKASLYKHFESKTDILAAYLKRFHQQWFERLETEVGKVADPQKKLLAIFDYYQRRQQIRQFGGCPFIKANNEAGMSDPRTLTEIQSAKKRIKKFIEKLVLLCGHKQILTDKELAETIYLMTEGAVVSASVFKQDADLKAAKKIIQKLI